ncbi:MAG: DUF58 domain-containing protein [Chloroflexi bacterium]|nr:DUF58 domain-containing protein [Chloroflexota bacterium]
MSEPHQLFDEKTRRKLEQLILSASRVRSGAIKGERRSVKRGTSTEFADYRNYAPGDDLRRLDWNIYARLERPLTKLYEDEEDLAVHLLLDASASMDWPTEGDPDAIKFTFARRLFAGLGYTSLTTNDRLLMTVVGGKGSAPSQLHHFGPARGRAYGVAMLGFVNDLEAGGIADWNDALYSYALRAGRPGLALVITDMFSPTGYIEGFNALLGKGYEVGLIHVLSRDEVEPPITGDLRLVDVETGQPQEVTIDAAMRELYMRRLAAWQDELRFECRRRGMHYIPIVTDSAWEKVILYDLRRLNLIK